MLREFFACLFVPGLTTFGLAWPIAHRFTLNPAEKLIAAGERHVVFVRPVKP